MGTISNVRLLTGHIGAEITGVALNSLDDSDVMVIRKTWLEHKVVFSEGKT